MIVLNDSSVAGEALAVPVGESRVTDRPRANRRTEKVVRVVPAISSTGAYLIIAVLLLVVLAGGTYVGYRINRGPESDRRGGGAEGEEP